MITRIPQRDYDRTKANLAPGTRVETKGRYELWQGRDILMETRSGVKQLKTNCWVVRDTVTGWETYWHGDKSQEHCEQAARRHLASRAD